LHKLELSRCVGVLCHGSAKKMWTIVQSRASAHNAATLASHGTLSSWGKGWTEQVTNIRPQPPRLRLFLGLGAAASRTWRTLHLTRRRAIEMQLQVDADLAKAVHREAFLAMTRVKRSLFD